MTFREIIWGESEMTMSGCSILAVKQCRRGVYDKDIGYSNGPLALPACQ
jgi:hypothetical protein